MKALAWIDKPDLPDPKTPIFEESELEAMHCYCLKYRDLVRAGETPTDEESDKFMAFQKVCYSEGVTDE